jgi:hypothetical protein
MLVRAENRYQAFVIHITISALVFLVLASIIIFTWYPGFLFKTDGGWAGIRLVAGVDFIIGPTMKNIIASGVLYFYKARYKIGYIEINKDTGDYIAIH